MRISGYGQSGPYRDRPGFAAIAESMGGLRYLAGYPDRPPVRVGVSIGDSLASLYGVIGALLAMHHLKNGGTGQYIDVALYEAVFGVMICFRSSVALTAGAGGGGAGGLHPNSNNTPAQPSFRVVCIIYLGCRSTTFNAWSTPGFIAADA